MDKTWLTQYPADVPAEIDTDAYASLAHVFDDSCARYGDSTAYISFGEHLNFTSLEHQARQFAAWLQGRGLVKGDRVALMMPNLIQYPVALYGTLRAGCVVVNCNPLYTARELAHQLQDSGATAIVIAENFAHTLQEVLAQSDIAMRHIVVTSIGDELGLVKGSLINFALRHIKKMVPRWRLPGSLRWREALRQGALYPFEAPPLAQHDLAFLQYTGGTTGLPKGAMLTHGNMVANLCQARAWIGPYVTEGKECIVTALPLYHIFALTANCLTYLSIGATNLLIVNPRDIPAFVKALRKTPFTAITGVNTLFNALLNHPDFEKVDFSHLRITLGGGMAVQRAVAEKWLKVTGKPISQAYGLTETSPAVTINPLSLTEFNGSIGLPIPSTEISIRDDDGHEVPAGETGELCVRGPQVSPGYWNSPEETRKVFHADGFLRTGDIAKVDEQGYVYIVDRKKDMVLVSGFNVYPNEVENVVAMHPGVREVAAVGVPDSRSGEAVKIFVIRKDPALTAEELIAHCRKHLSGYKVPRHVEFREDLPRTNVGKILRRALRDEEKAKE